MAAKDYSVYGKKFNRLTILSDAQTIRSTAPRVWALCDCGTLKEYIKVEIKSGKTKSCGCLKKDAPVNLIHGHAARGKESPTYRTYMGMMRRCYSQSCREFNSYGARGITVCDHLTALIMILGILQTIASGRPRPSKQTIGEVQSLLNISEGSRPLPNGQRNLGWCIPLSIAD